MRLCAPHRVGGNGRPCMVPAVLECLVCLSAWRPVAGVSPALSQSRPPSKRAPRGVPPSDSVPFSQCRPDPPSPRGHGRPMRAVNQGPSPKERDVSPWEDGTMASSQVRLRALSRSAPCLATAVSRQRGSIHSNKHRSDGEAPAP